MQKFKIFSASALAVAAQSCLCLSAIAANTPSPYGAVPFVAADKPDSDDFKASLVTTPGKTFAVQCNPSRDYKGSYSGVLIRPTRTHVTTDFQTFSFLFKGDTTAIVTAHSGRPQRGSFNYTWSTVGNGDTGQVDGDGFHKITLTAGQLGMSAGSRLDRLVITADENSDNQAFLVKDLTINGASVDSSVLNGTKFFKSVANGSNGPLGESSNKRGRFWPTPKGGIGKLGATPGIGTSVSFTNNSGQTATCFMTLTPAPAEISKSISTFSQLQTNATITSYDGNPLHGTFQLSNNQTVSFQANSSSVPILSANLYVGNQAECTLPYGETFVEFTLNVDNQPLSLETVDISEVNGVNAEYMINLPIPTPDSETCIWDNSNYLNSGAFIPITTISNNPGAAPSFTGDANNIGVYPYGCDVCNARQAPPDCLTYPSGNTGCSTVQNACQAFRAYQCSGGTVAVTLTNFPYPPSSGPTRPGPR